MKKFKKTVKKVIMPLFGIYAKSLRSSQNKTFDKYAAKLQADSSATGQESIALVLMPGSDVSEPAIKRITDRLSGQYKLNLITFPKKELTFKKINDAIISSDSDYVFLLNNIYDVTSGFDLSVISELKSSDNIGVIGIPSYYSPLSGITRSYLVKQEGLFTEKHTKKNSSFSEYSIKTKNNQKTDWLKKQGFTNELIPSTDFLFMSMNTFKDIGAFSIFYDVNYLTFPLSDLCITANAKGYETRLSRAAVCAANSATADADAKKTNKEVFRGRWYRDLSEKSKDKTGVTPVKRQSSDASDNNCALDPKSIDILGPMPDNETTKNWGDYHFAVALKKSFEKKGYKANILPRERWYDRSNSKYVLVLRGLRPYYKSALGYDQVLMYWPISHPAEISHDELRQADYIFYPSEKMREHFEGDVSVPSCILPQCTDPEVMKNEEGCTMSPELLFIGNSRHIFRRILKDLLPTDHELKVYGRHWDDYPQVKEHLVAEYYDNSKISTAYHNAAILLNDHWDDMLEYGIISNRIFDALSAGAFVISDEVSGIHELLGDSVVTYKDKQDLHDKIEYYLSHKDERDKIAASGYDNVIKNHTFDNRAELIIEKMGQF
ncbi:CgeB family protein [Butyrivibrio sp. VCD2006]|uniref:CgeB family protein n=1 Tax=Butyrivibrio sp. VCD2006 TaxID=1280664 RepID=UPI0004072634|nr:glycosyltransferase [Butyrivibrio sp. VCD2006]